MTNFSLTKETAAVEHSCTSDLAQLRFHGGQAWECTVCHAPVFIEHVVEGLRERAVAQDAATRLQYLRGTPEPGSVVGHAPAEHAYFAPLIPPKKLREQGAL